MAASVYLQDWPLAVPEAAVPHLYQLARRLGAAVHWDPESGAVYIECALCGRTIGLDCAPGAAAGVPVAAGLRQRLEAAGAQVVQPDGVIRTDLWLRLALWEAAPPGAGTAVLLPRLGGRPARRLAGLVQAAVAGALGAPVGRRWLGWWPGPAPGVTLAGPPPPGEEARDRLTRALHEALIHHFRPGAPAPPLPTVAPPPPGAGAPAPPPRPATRPGAGARRPGAAAPPLYVWEWILGQDGAANRHRP